jgi:glycosyltransferase involved in cell wall biosynthesis
MISEPAQSSVLSPRSSSLRLAIDVTAGVNQGAGIGRVTRATVEALAALPAAPALTLFYCREPTAVADAGSAWLAGLAARHPAVRIRRLPLPPRWVTFFWLRHRLPLPAELVTGPVDVLLAPDFVAPPAARARTIITVHDLSYLIVPQYADPGLRRYLTAAVPRALRRAAHVVAVSEATRRDLITRLGLPPERVSTVYNGVDPRFRPLDPAARAAARARLGLPERFVLTLGTLEPRKNHLGLLRAFARLAGAEPDLALVVGGRRGWLDQPIFDEVRRLGLEERVRFLGGVPDDDLPALYAAATAFAYPSWYEGFGLPPLEALACGVPVVASRAGALPEVCGEAALLVKPGDTDALAAALARALGDAALRAELARRGPAQAARFTWPATARRLLEVMARVR